MICLLVNRCCLFPKIFCPWNAWNWLLWKCILSLSQGLQWVWPSSSSLDPPPGSFWRWVWRLLFSRYQRLSQTTCPFTYGMEDPSSGTSQFLKHLWMCSVWYFKRKVELFTHPPKAFLKYYKLPRLLCRS